MSKKVQIKGLIYNIQRFSLHDGPGIRTVVFLKGCSLKCIWCSNPESQYAFPEIMFNNKICIKCGKCAQVCTQNAIQIKNTRKRINRLLCCNCGKCSDVCPTNAIITVGKYMTEKELINEVEKDDIFYFSSSGGVTFSGGEPLNQAKFLKSVLKKIKSKGIHTAVETSGYTSWENLDSIIPYTDLFLYDIKHINNNQHKELTCCENDVILENLEKLSKKTNKIVFRIPVIPELNDTRYNFREIIKLAKKYNIKLLHLLPYHEFGIMKYEMLGREYHLKKLGNVSSSFLTKVKKIIERNKLKVIIGGE